VSDAVITLTGKVDQLIAENEKANKSIDKLTLALHKLSKEGRQQAKDEKEGMQVTKEHASAMEMYALRVERADRLLKAGTITAATHRREIEKANAELSSEKPVNALQAQLAKLATMATAIGSVRLAWKLASSEFDNYIARQKAAKDETISFADASREMMVNFVPDKTMGVGDLGAAIAKVSKETGADQKHVAQAFGDTFSSKGAATNQEATQFVAEAFKVAPKNPELAKELSARALDLSRQTGVTDPRALLGFLTEVQGKSRITSMPQLGKQGTPAILGTMKAGASLEQSAELFATINNLMADAEGANSKTATLQLVDHLMDEEKLGKAGLSKKFKGKGVMERLSMLQGDRKLADKFLNAEGMSFEIQAKPFIQGLVRGDAESMAALADTQAGISGITANSPKAFEQFLKTNNAGPGQGAAMLDARLGAAVQGQMIGGPGTDAAIVRDKLFGEKGVLSGNVENLAGIDSLKKRQLQGSFEASLLAGATPQEAGIRVLGMESIDRAKGASSGQDAIQSTRLLTEVASILQQQLDEQKKANNGGGIPPRQPMKPGADPAMGGQPR
jgi:hypothetical protein